VALEDRVGEFAPAEVDPPGFVDDEHVSHGQVDDAVADLRRFVNKVLESIGESGHVTGFARVLEKGPGGPRRRAGRRRSLTPAAPGFTSADDSRSHI
jgi:hypothetical protein